MNNVVVGKPVYIDMVNVYQNWYNEPNVVNRKSYMPVVILPLGEPVDSLSVEPNTVILRVVET